MLNYFTHLWNFISSRGVEHIEDNRIRRKVELCNQVSAIAFFIIAIIGSSPYWFNSSSFVRNFYIISGIVFALPILFNHFGYTTFARFLFTIIPPADILLIAGIVSSNDPNLSLKLSVTGTIVVPALLFDITEKRFMFFGIAWVTLIFILFDRLQQLIPLAEGIDPAAMDNSFTFLMNGIVTIAITALAFYYSQRLNYTAEEELEAKKKLLEEKTQELEELNNSKDAILGVVAHDLKNPMAAIIGITDVVTAQSDKGKEAISMVRDAAKSSLHIIEDLVEMTTLENRKAKIITRRIQLSEFLQSAITINQVLAEQKGVKIIAESVCDDVYVELNREKFIRVINNLLSNAIKFSYRNSSIIIRCDKKSEQRVLISIEDFGIGIPDQLQPHIFEKFTSASRRGTEGEQTLGLGMSITKRIIELHGGVITFTSKEGKGTTFYIELNTAKQSNEVLMQAVDRL